METLSGLERKLTVEGVPMYSKKNPEGGKMPARDGTDVKWLRWGKGFFKGQLGGANKGRPF